MMKHVLMSVAAVLAGAPMLWAQATTQPAKVEAKAGTPQARKADPPPKTEKNVEVRVRANPRKDAGWLGIRLSPVPAALARHLGIEGGLMVGNVLKGSPADKAGLQQYDLIVQVDAQPVASDMETFSRSIQAKKPGDLVRLRVFHRGQAKEAQAMLEAYPDDPAKHPMKYPDEVDPNWTDNVNLRTRVMGIGPDGKVIEIDPQQMMPNLREILRGAGIPGGQGDMNIRIAGNNARVSISRSDNGRNIRIEQDQDGKITVARSQAGGKEETKTYSSADELAKGDAEAADLLKSTRANVKIITSGQGGLEALPGLDADIEVKVKELQEKARQDAEGARAQADRMARDAREQADRIAKEIRDKLAAEGHPMPPMLRQVQREFRVAEDGKIEVTIRKNGDQVNLTFKNQQEFEQKEPKLFEEFKKAKQ